MSCEKKLLKTSKTVFMYSNSLGRHFSQWWQIAVTKVDISVWLFLEYLDGNLLRIHRGIKSKDKSKVGHEVFYSRNPLTCAELNTLIQQSARKSESAMKIMIF